MRLYVPGAGGRGRQGWNVQADEDAWFADFEPGASFEDKVASILDGAPTPPVTLLAHSAGAVPATLITGRRSLSVSRLVLVEPALYDIARGHPAIETHIGTLTTARSLAAAGNFFGYWKIVGPLMFGAPASEANWERDEPQARRFYGMGVPWGSDVTAQMIEGTPTLVITGGWNDEYEAIAEVLTAHGAQHRQLIGARHRPQDLPAFESIVARFESDDFSR